MDRLPGDRHRGPLPFSETTSLFGKSIWVETERKLSK